MATVNMEGAVLPKKKKLPVSGTGYIGSGYDTSKVFGTSPAPPPPTAAPYVTSPAQDPASSLNIALQPDYASILKNAPDYTSGEAALKAIYDPTNPNAGSAAAQRAAAIRAAIIQYGRAPTAADTYGDITSADIQAANNNPNSILAQLQNAYQTNVQQDKNTMEQRGIYSSGATNQAVGTEGQHYQQSQYDALNNLNNLVSNAIQGYTQAGNEYGINHAALVRQVTQILQQDPSITSTTAKLVPGSQDNYGQPIYADAAGQLYTADGKPYTPVTFVAPTPPAPATPPPGDFRQGYQGYGKGAQL